MIREIPVILRLLIHSFIRYYYYILYRCCMIVELLFFSINIYILLYTIMYDDVLFMYYNL